MGFGFLRGRLRGATGVVVVALKGLLGLNGADYTLFVCKGYSRSCFQMRNEWMVNHSSRVIAAYNREKGGTKNTIGYAIRNGIPVFFIENE